MLYKRYFNGKRFSLLRIVRTRPYAEKIKEIFKKQGYKVRLIKVKKGIEIYVRGKNYID